MNSCNGNKAAL